MALITVEVQGAGRVKQRVLLDDISGEIYAVPIYKIGIGIEGTDDGPVSATNPLPAMISDGTDTVGVVGDGDTVDLFEDSVVGSTKGITTLGHDGSRLRIPRLTEAGEQRTDDVRSLQLLEQMLTVLKKIEYHLYLASDADLKDQDV